jgi:hypothetical protein
MKTVKCIVLVLTIIAFASFTHAKGLKNDKQTKDLATRATNLFGEEKIKEGFLLLKPHWPMPEAEIENLINQTEMQWSVVEKRFGKSISVEFIREERIAESFIKYLFMQKFENHAIRWEIIFYKPRDIWKMNMVKWDDKIHLLFSD